MMISLIWREPPGLARLGDSHLGHLGLDVGMTLEPLLYIGRARPGLAGLGSHFSCCVEALVPQHERAPYRPPLAYCRVLGGALAYE